MLFVSLHSLERGVAEVADALAVIGADLLHEQMGRARLLADGQVTRQHTIAVGDIGRLAIDGVGQGDVTVIIANGPLVYQQYLQALEETAHLTIKDQVSLAGDIDMNIFGFQAGHRRYDGQPTG